ncbi:MAG: hypothetical protein ABI867_24090 [Kofleriaceae bacterium]
MNKPSWWSDQHEGTWDRIKGALKRDWEQTKADLTSKSGHDLDQDVGDTVKQAVGKEPLPPGNQPNPSDSSKDSWDHAEPGYRYGAGARQQYGTEHPSWDTRVESKLSEEWGQLKSGQTWKEIKGYVRRGWDHDGKK